MKRKIISTLFALVLAVSLCTVMAVPAAAAEETNYGDYTLTPSAPGTAVWSTEEANSGKSSVKLFAPADGSGYGNVAMTLDMAFDDLADFSAWVEGGEVLQALPLLKIEFLESTLPADVDLSGGNNHPGGEHVNLSSYTRVNITSQPGQSEDLSDTLVTDALAGWEKYGTHSGADIDVGTGAYWTICDYDLADGTYFYDYFTWDEIKTIFAGATVTDVKVELIWPQLDGGEAVTPPGEVFEPVASTIYVDDILINDTTYVMEPEPIFLDASYYQVDDIVTVTVIDASANTSATTRETVLVTAAGDVPVHSIVLGLLETGVNTGVFTETFTLVGTTPGTGELLVSHGSTITVADGSGTDTATVDNVAPVIDKVTSPLASSNITDNRPVISADYADVGLSGIDTKSVVITVGGVDKTLLATVTTSSVTYTPTANLSDGTYAVTVDVDDLAGNAATQASWSFTVDTIDPAITGQVATPSVIEPDVSANITFTATVADTTSGVATVTIDVSSIDTATALPMLNDGDGIYSANITTTITTEATYKLLVTATDYAGNSDSANITLGVWLDIVDPVITDPAITYEYGSSVPPDGTVTISANVTDDVLMGTVTAACTAFTGDVNMTADGDIYTGTATVKSDAAKGTYTITITAEDAKGNEATPVSLTLDVDPAPTGYDIALYEGWNLISLPLIPTDDSIDVVLADISDNVSQVRTWVYVAGVLTEKVWAEGGTVGDLTQMAAGRGYWIKMTEVNELTVTGVELPAPPLTPPSYSVYEGWNLIGFKSLSDTTLAQVYLGQAVMLTFERMYGYDAAAGIYTVIRPDIDDLLQPGQGYWLAVSAAGTIYP